MIDSRAIIHPSAKIADNVRIEPFAVIGAEVEIGDGCIIHSHAVVKGPTKIGRHNKIFQFASVGEDCQDMKYKGEYTQLEIGDYNIIRESCTIHRGTQQDAGITKIGNQNLLMAYVHIAHDCVIGNNCILSNNAALAGHVKMGNYVLMGGFAAVHQFCQIGSYSMMRAATLLLKDLPAYIMATGSPAKAAGMNFEGMRRRQWSAETILALRKAYKVIYRQGNLLRDAIKILEDMAFITPEIKLLIESLKSSKRGIVR